MRKVAALLLGLSVVGTPATQANAGPAPSGRPDLTRTYPGESYSQYYPRYYRGPGYYGRPYYYRRHRDYNGAVAAGVAGSRPELWLPAPWRTAKPKPLRRLHRHRQPAAGRLLRPQVPVFDPVTGTYLAVTGERIVCTD